MSDRTDSIARHEPFIYGLVGWDLYFMPLRKALEWALTYAAGTFATDWGDLLSRLPRDEGRRVIENWQDENNGKPNPPEEARFMERERDGFIEERSIDELHWAPPMMLEWFPKEALQDFSRADVLNTVDEEDAADLAAGNVISRKQWLAANDRKVGWIGLSMHAGELLTLPSEREEAIVAHFSKFGIKCVRNDALIHWAHCEWMYGDEHAGPPRGISGDSGDLDEQRGTSTPPPAVNDAEDRLVRLPHQPEELDEFFGAASFVAETMPDAVSDLTVEQKEGLRHLLQATLKALDA